MVGRDHRAAAGRWLGAGLLLWAAMASSQQPAAAPTSPGAADALDLSPAEQAWIQAHPVIRASGDPDWAPLDAQDESGRRVGISPQVLESLCRRLGIRVEWIPVASWDDALKAARQGRVDVLTSAGISADRQAYLLFTRAYLRFRSVIVVRDDADFVNDMADLRDARFAIARSYVEAGLFRRNYPQYQRVEVDSIADALSAVASGAADATVGNVAVVSHYIHTRGLTNLRVAASFLEEDRPLHFAVRRDWPELVALLDRGLDSMSESELKGIQERWLPVRFQRGLDPAQVYSMARWGGVAVLVAVVLMLLWVWWLRRELSYRRESERRIHEAQRLLREVTDRIPGGVVYQFERRADGSLRTNFVSAGVQAITGYTRDQALHDYSVVLNSVIPEDRPRLMDAIAQSAQTMSPYVIEYRTRNGDGEIEWLRGTAEPSPGPAGGIIWNGFTTRINELKQVEREIRSAKELLQEVTDGLPGAVYRFRGYDRDRLEILFASSGLAPMLGLPARQSPPTFEDLLSRLHPEDRELIRKDILESARNLRPLQRDLRVRWLDGTERWIHAGAAPHHGGASGELIWNGYAVDITDRKHLEQELNRTRAHVVDLAHNLPGVVYQSCLHANGTVELLFNHEAYFRLLGIEHDSPKIPHEKLVDNVVPEDREKLLDALMRSAAELTPVAVEFRVRGAQGIRWIYVEAIPRSGGSRSILAVWNAYGLDITERKELEAELAAAKTVAEEANRAKGEFLANMSHEIRTPMNAVIGLSHLALRTHPEPRLRDYLSKIESSAQSLLRIINDILDFSKIEAGKMGLEHTTFDVAEVLSQLHNVASVRAAEKGLQFQCRLAPGTPARLVGDPLRLGQVLLNLASNAVKFTEKGRVSVELGEERREAARCWMRIRVTDTGIGMSEEQQAKLFQSFSQADASTTRRYGGTGLGLSITHRLVELMHGQISCRSTPGEGTEFSLLLPLEIPAQGEDVAPLVGGRSSSALQSLRPGSLAGLQVLVVEDNAINQQVAREFIEDAGAVVHCVENGALAVQHVAGHRVDLMLMDLQMPEMDGIEATRRLRSAGHAMPIVAMTASAMPEDRERCLQTGMNDYVSKPLDVEQLAAALARVLGRSMADLLAWNLPPPAAPVPVASRAELQALILQLDGQLMDHEAEAMDTVDRLIAGSGSEPPRALRELAQHTHAFRFHEARVLVGDVKVQLGLIDDGVSP
ncbi:MAG TPA: transporter substrate-binding domain-containing protein [Solimonas sp.]|nr:transporter substrate-binding domain-containing protein [Solimonas sp.]